MTITTGGLDVALPRSADEGVTALYRVHAAGLRRVAVLLVGDAETAEDVVQDAFVRLHCRWRLLREPEKALAYLRTSVVNGSRSRLRRRRTERAYVPAASTDVPSAEHQVLRTADLRAVADGLRELPSPSWPGDVGAEQHTRVRGRSALSVASPAACAGVCCSARGAGRGGGAH